MRAILACVEAARARLRAAGVPDQEADLDARLLARHVLDWDAARLLTDGIDPPPPGFSTAYGALIDRRTAREPMAYILGVQEFWGLAFEVAPAVLIPRPETEVLVEAALSQIPAAGRHDVADVCTGGGCVAIAIAHDRTNTHLVAVDNSHEALAIGAANATRHGVADRITFACGDLLALPSLAQRTFDMIVSNPPYVADGERSALQPEVRDYEPAAALFAGHDGLSIIRRLVAQSVARLRPGGFLMFEIGQGQAGAVRELISATPGLTMSGLKHDLQGIPRTVIARRDAQQPGR
jgi:release factor glutamine methyltransferase